MSEQEKSFLQRYKNINWTFIAFQVIILIFYIGYSYSRLGRVETEQTEIHTRQELIEQRMVLKADKSDVAEMRNDIRDIRNLLMNQK